MPGPTMLLDVAAGFLWGWLKAPSICRMFTTTPWSCSSRCGKATALTLYLLDIAARTKPEFSANDSIIVKTHKAQESPKEHYNCVQPIFASILDC